MQQPGDEGPRLQMWLGSIRQDQECSSGRLCVWERVEGVGVCVGETERNGGKKKEWKTLLIRV